MKNGKIFLKTILCENNISDSRIYKNHFNILDSLYYVLYTI